MRPSAEDLALLRGLVEIPSVSRAEGEAVEWLVGQMAEAIIRGLVRAEVVAHAAQERHSSVSNSALPGTSTAGSVIALSVLIVRLSPRRIVA